MHVALVWSGVVPPVLPVVAEIGFCAARAATAVSCTWVHLASMAAVKEQAGTVPLDFTVRKSDIVGDELRGGRGGFV